MKDKVQKLKPTKSRDDQDNPLIGCMVQHEEIAAERPVIKKINK